ncbi:unnamed protein product [Vicia faba]|uniref:Uncharacterized protein n=1 Tax=Vicia faba TaxID=3906 RepID=A0AAV0YZ58_VICFA|nr:unnamed protein product [Vicia faba]
MDKYDDYVSVDLNNVYYTDLSDVEYIDDEDVNVVVSSGHQSSDDEDDVDNDDDEESVGAEWSNSRCCRYGKCKGFAIRKNNVKQKGSEGSEIVVMR